MTKNVKQFDLTVDNEANVASEKLLDLNRKKIELNNKLDELNKKK